MKSETPLVAFGQLNQISKPTIQARVDGRTTSFFDASRRAAIDQYQPDTLARRGAFRGVVLRVEPSVPAILPFIADMFPPDLLQVVYRVKARIPELHAAIPEPSQLSAGPADTGPHNWIIDMHPTYTATSHAGTANWMQPPVPGDIVMLDYEDRQNYDGPQLLSVFQSQNPGGGGAPGTYPPGAGGLAA